MIITKIGRSKSISRINRRNKMARRRKQRGGRVHPVRRQRGTGGGKPSMRGGRKRGRSSNSRALANMTFYNVSNWGHTDDISVGTQLTTNFPGMPDFAYFTMSVILYLANDLISGSCPDANGNCTVSLSDLMAEFGYDPNIPDGTWWISCGNPSCSNCSWSLTQSDGGHSHTVNGECNGVPVDVNIHNHFDNKGHRERLTPGTFPGLLRQKGGRVNPVRRQRGGKLQRGGRVNTTNNRSIFSGRTQNNLKGRPKK